MSVASEHPDIAPSPDTPAKRRRAAAQHVREARDRLISTTGTRPASPAGRFYVFNHTLALPHSLLSQKLSS